MTKLGAKSFSLIAAVWGGAGVSALLIFAIVRLGRISVEALNEPWNIGFWALLVANVVFMAYAEGYRGFQRSFSPRAAARVLYLFRNAGFWNGLLAPFFCAGYFQAMQRTMRVVWIGTVVILVLVIAVQATPQPWRGIIDAGVVVGLSWGVLSFWYELFRAFATGEYPRSPEIPGAAIGEDRY